MRIEENWRIKMPPKDLVIGEITSCYFLTPDGQQIEMNGVINDIEVTPESIPDGVYVPKMYDKGSFTIYTSNNDRKFHHRPMRRGRWNKRMKCTMKDLFGVNK